ncbi:MAG: serine hydrolase [Clostridia bacterium]|nr:serine hydrolase [Clostridia bacterium]
MESTLNQIVSFIKEQKYNIYGVTEITDGEEKSKEIVPAPWCTDVYSVSKFISGAAVGLLYDRGLVDLHTPIVKLIENCPEPAEPKWKEVTLHDCLRHETGLINGNLDIDNPNDEGISDWLSYILALPIEGTRAVDYHYTDAAFYLVCRVVESIIHENVFAFLHRELFVKLGFRESSWSVCPQGYTTGGSGFCANDRDIARLGYLWANEGKYKNMQLLSPEYIKLSLENGYGIVRRDAYPDCYYKTGANGQIIIMIPAEKRAVMIRGYYSSDDRTVLVDKFFTK